MQKNMKKYIGIGFVGFVLCGFLASCKASHEVCPAYTKVENSKKLEY